jgi:hypothetical protein
MNRIKRLEEEIELLKKYIKYVHDYPDDHEIQGDYPVCFDEWWNNEYEMLAECVECGEEFYQDKDLQICDECEKLFDTKKLWKLHDKNELDALDFNESKSFREKFRIK